MPTKNRPKRNLLTVRSMDVSPSLTCGRMFLSKLFLCARLTPCQPVKAPGKVGKRQEANLLSKASNHFHSTGREHALGGQTLLTLTHRVCAQGWGSWSGGGFVVSRASLVQLTLWTDWLRETEWRSDGWMGAWVDFMPCESSFTLGKKSHRYCEDIKLKHCIWIYTVHTVQYV